MFQSVRQLAERISSLIAERPFSCGVLTGLAAALALLLFFLLLAFIFRSRKLRCIVIPSAGGDLCIVSNKHYSCSLAVYFAKLVHYLIGA